MIRRTLSILLILSMLLAVVATAMSEDAAATLEDDGVPSDAEEILPWEQPVPEIAGDGAGEQSEDLVGPDEDIYGSDDSADVTHYITLKYGDRDEVDAAAYVLILQNRLYELGYLTSEVDGVYGGDTEEAIKLFQRLNGIPEDGIATPELQSMLFGDASLLVLPTKDNILLQETDEVRVQTRLIQWGFLNGKPDGVLGSASKDAIKTFKRYVYDYQPPTPTPTPSPTPEPTPTPTPPPDELPDVVDAPVPTPVPEPTPVRVDYELDSLLMNFVDGAADFNVFRKTVSNGDKGQEVTRVQTRLHTLGYLYNEADGAFGSSTELALKYFQRRNGLMETGTADEGTQRMLFSDMAVESDMWVNPYKLVVDISEQYVYVYGWDGGGYGKRVDKFICSTGKNATPTPLGTYQCYGPTGGEWYYFKDFNCYAKWGWVIKGGIMFHSVTFNANKKQSGSEHNLGRKASHGCVRLKIKDAYWIWHNCPKGTTVVVQK